MDLGECSKIHDLALRADYEIASKERDLFFELDVSVLCFVTCAEHASVVGCVMLMFVFHSGCGSSGIVHC